MMNENSYIDTFKKMMRLLLAEQNTNISTLEKEMHKSTNVIQQALKRGSMKTELFFEIADHLGKQVVLIDKK